jgi:16S rRNA (adenine1518-N6/adenine1519-N6)-dimethyltransferase
VEWADVDGRSALEIGPGHGALTALLAARARYLLLVEIDPALASALRRRYRDEPRVATIEADVLSLDLRDLDGAPFVVVGNLPYESGTAIVRKLIASPDVVTQAIVMLQKEVCQRMLAREREEHYGALSIFTALRADVTEGQVVAPTSFRPAPKVDSQLLRLAPLEKLRWDVGDEEHFEAVIQRAFSGRRKMLRNTLGRWLGARLGAERAAELFADCDIPLTARPEEIGPEGFARLSARSYKLLANNARAS